MASDDMDRRTELERELAEVRARLEWVTEVLRGKPVCDFAQSFPEVSAAMDAMTMAKGMEVAAYGILDLHTEKAALLQEVLPWLPAGECEDPASRGLDARIHAALRRQRPEALNHEPATLSDDERGDIDLAVAGLAAERDALLRSASLHGGAWCHEEGKDFGDVFRDRASVYDRAIATLRKLIGGGG